MRVDKHGNKIWENEKGEMHRENGPAIEYANGQKDWFVDGLRHRIEGPAIERPNGLNGWYIQGKWITNLVLELLRKSEFGKEVHLGILADYWAERGDFRLLEIVQPFLSELK